MDLSESASEDQLLLRFCEEGLLSDLLDFCEIRPSGDIPKFTPLCCDTLLITSRAKMFEGSEKRLEIEFTISSEFPLGLRCISRYHLDQLLDRARCSIISFSHIGDLDGYVLSESSLFVYKDIFILKTCGRTRLLATVKSLLKHTKQLGMTIKRVKYSRASFLFPNEQFYPHQGFDKEVAELEKYFGFLGGSSYVMGDQSRGLQWHLYYGSVDRSVPEFLDRSIEICLTGLNPLLSKRFYRSSLASARDITLQTGLADLIGPDAVDDYVFDPCGYSMNAMSDLGIVTVHVTPEEDCSYASVELCHLAAASVDLDAVMRQVVSVFDPKEIHVAVHSAVIEDLEFLKEASLSGYLSDGLSVQYLSDGTFVAFRRLDSRKTEIVRAFGRLNSSTSSDHSEDVCMDCYPVDDQQSVISSDCAPFGLQNKKYQMNTICPSDLPPFIESIIRRNSLEETFYVFNLSEAKRLLEKWRSNLPRVEPFYAIKCNPDEMLIRMLYSMGAGFDCASRDEIKLVMDFDVASSKIIFANACKHPSDIRAAREYGVELTTFDTLSELEKLKVGMPNARTLLRIRSDDPQARCCLGNKYGANMSNLGVLFKKARELDVTVVGVSFHVGSGATNAEAFVSAIDHARIAFDLGLSFGFDMSILDIGGGFVSGKFDDVTEAINAAIELHFPIESGVRIIAEPGRFLAETCATLACLVIGTRDRVVDGQVKKDYWITDGLYGSFNCIMYDHATVRPTPLRKEVGGEKYASTVFGPTCDGLDTVMEDVILPELRCGDWLMFPHMGAYALAGASNFNGINAIDVKTFYTY